MSRPVEVIDPVTGARSYTKHPERLLRRGHALRGQGGELRILPAGFAARLSAAEAEIEFQKNRGDRVYWNGVMGSDKCYPPGCNVHFRWPGAGDAKPRSKNLDEYDGTAA